LVALIKNIPVLPLRDMVVYPHGVHPLFVGTESSIRALDQAMADDKQVLLLAKIDAEANEPKAGDLYDVGTIATILQLLKLPDGTVKVLVEGGQRARVEQLVVGDDFITADAVVGEEPELESRESEGLGRSLLAQFEQYVQASKKVPQEVLSSLSSIDDPARLVDTIAADVAQHQRQASYFKRFRTQTEDGSSSRINGCRNRCPGDGKAHSWAC
jgi:ATP-dependent Lon protease